MPCAGILAEYRKLLKTIAAVIGHYGQSDRVLNDGVKEVADEVANIIQDGKSSATCTWLESGFRREGNYGFNEHAQNSGAWGKNTTPSSSPRNP